MDLLVNSYIELLFLAAAGSSVVTGIGILILNPYRSINRIFALVLGTIAVWFACIFMGIREARYYTPETHEIHNFWFRFGACTAGVLPWLMQVMIAAIADPGHATSKILRKASPWLLVPAALVILVFSESYIPSESRPENPARGYGYALYFWVMLIQGTVMFVHASRRMRRLTGVQKIEMQLFALNTGLACIIVLVTSFIGRLFHLPLLSRSGPLVLCLLYGQTVWLICYHKIFDARQVIASLAHRSLYFLVFSIAAISIGLLLNQPAEQAFTPLIAAMVAILLASMCGRITRRLFKLDHELRLAEPRQAVVAMARKTSDASEVKLLFEQYLRSWCQCERAALLISNGNVFTSDEINFPNAWIGLTALSKVGWLTPERLQRQKPSTGSQECLRLILRDKLGLMLAVPPGSDVPTLVIALGTKKSLRPYTYPEIRILLDIVELMDNAISHSILSAHASKLRQMESAVMVSRSLAHDLNNLTTPVATYLLHTQGRATPGSLEAEVHNAAWESVNVMNEYIRESLFFSRRLYPEFKEIEPQEILGALTTVTQERAGQHGISLQFQCGIHASFRADPVLFQRLALNLIHNAIDASPQGSTVTILLFSKDAGTVALAVSDQGSGVPVENLQRIFDAYFTTKNVGNSERGLGLGLTICRKIAELHGGEISVESTLGQGAIFVATFPQLIATDCQARARATVADSTAWGHALVHPRPV
jgi:signal transduction histidine kinase